MIKINELPEIGFSGELPNIWPDMVSGSRSDRPKLNALLEKLRSGDTLFAWKLDRMARSLIHRVKIVDDFKKSDIGFKSFTESFIDTRQSSPHSDLLLNIIGFFAQDEKDLISERTKAGLESARRMSKVLGHPRGLSKKGERKRIWPKCISKKGSSPLKKYWRNWKYRGAPITNTCG